MGITFKTCLDSGPCSHLPGPPGSCASLLRALVWPHWRSCCLSHTPASIGCSLRLAVPPPLSLPGLAPAIRYSRLRPRVTPRAPPTVSRRSASSQAPQPPRLWSLGPWIPKSALTGQGLDPRPFSQLGQYLPHGGHRDKPRQGRALGPVPALPGDLRPHCPGATATSLLGSKPHQFYGLWPVLRKVKASWLMRGLLWASPPSLPPLAPVQYQRPQQIAREVVTEKRPSLAGREEQRGSWAGDGGGGVSAVGADRLPCLHQP